MRPPRNAARRRGSGLVLAALPLLGPLSCVPASPLPSLASGRLVQGRPASVDLGMVGARPDRAASEVRFTACCIFVPPVGGDADFIGQGSGGGISFAYRPASGGDPEGDVYFEWGLERSAHKEVSSGRAAEYWRANAGFRRAVPWGDPAEIFFSTGAGYHAIAVSGGRELAGPGIYGGMGVELLLAKAASFLLSARLQYFWGGGSDDGNGLSGALAAGAGLRF